MAKKATVKATSIKATKDEERVYFEPDEWYLGEFTEVEINEGTYGPYMIMKFKILNGQMEDGTSAKGKTCTQMVNAVLSPSSELWKFVKVFTKSEPEIDEDYDLTSHYGEKFRCYIKDKKKNKNNPDKRFQHVETIKRRAKKTKDS